MNILLVENDPGKLLLSKEPCSIPDIKSAKLTMARVQYVFSRLTRSIS